jgi:hypothetical protein
MPSLSPILFAQKMGLTLKQAKLLAGLNTPRKIQDFLVYLPQNFEPDGDTARSVKSALKANKAHCIEGAMIAAMALWLQGHPPLLIDLCAHRDMDHVIAPFKQNGKWGAISKTNYTCLRWRDPVYRSVRELVMSYFHEFAKGSRKSLRSYSNPYDLRKFPTKLWVDNPNNCWELTSHISVIKHYKILDEKAAKQLRPRDAVEIKTDKINVFPIPNWKKRRL